MNQEFKSSDEDLYRAYGAMSPMGIYENYFMPSGYKPIKEEKIL